MLTLSFLSPSPACPGLASRDAGFLEPFGRAQGTEEAGAGRKQRFLSWLLSWGRPGKPQGLDESLTERGFHFQSFGDDLKPPEAQGYLRWGQARREAQEKAQGAEGAVERLRGGDIREVVTGFSLGPPFSPLSPGHLNGLRGQETKGK